VCDGEQRARCRSSLKAADATPTPLPDAIDDLAGVLAVEVTAYLCRYNEVRPYAAFAFGPPSRMHCSSQPLPGTSTLREA
jgi:hypothetical protein